jgi:hypothetical protein
MSKLGRLATRMLVITAGATLAMGLAVSGAHADQSIALTPDDAHRGGNIINPVYGS